MTVADDSFYGEYTKFIQGSEAVERRYLGKLVETAQKIVDFEISAVKEKMASVGTGEQFEGWLDSFYGWNFLERAKEWMGPIVKEVMTAAQVPALDILGGSSSRRQILAVIRNTKEEEEIEYEERRRTMTPEELAVHERFKEWSFQGKRAKGIGADEAVREVGAAERNTWAKSGVTKLVWKANPGACPLCRKLNGRVVGIDEPFLKDKEVLTGKYEKPPEK